MLVLVIGCLLGGVAFAFLVRGVAAGSAARRRALDQIAAYGFAGGPAGAGSVPPASAPAAGLRAVLARVAVAFGTHAASRLAGSRRDELRALLRSAGLQRTSVASFLGYRALATLFLPLVWVWLLAAAGGVGAIGVVGALCLAGLGWSGPVLLLRRRIRHRLAAIDREVPELVDLLVTTVEAGVGFGAALQLAARRVQGPLGDELRLALGEQAMGLTTDEALRNMLARADTGSLRAFVQAVLQGETLGVSIGRILRDLAVDLRKRCRRGAEERAQKAPLKIVFPLVGLIFPALFIVSLGPLVIAFLRGLGSA